MAISPQGGFHLESNGKTEQKTGSGKRLSFLEQLAGPVVMSALCDPLVVEVDINADGNVWVEQNGKLPTVVGNISAANRYAMVGLVAEWCGKTCHKDDPLLSANWPFDQSRIEAGVPPIAQGPFLAIRKKAIRVYTLENYLAAGMITLPQKTALEEAIRQKENILVSGGTGSGKTTFLNAIFDTLAKLAPNERIITIEDIEELQVPVANLQKLFTSEETRNKDGTAYLPITMTRLVKSAMRLRPNGIILGEVRDGAALDLLDAANTGHYVMGTVHANSAPDALVRLEDLIRRVSTPIPREIAKRINVVVDIQRDYVTGNGRKVRGIDRITGYDAALGEYIRQNLAEPEPRNPGVPEIRNSEAYQTVLSSPSRQSIQAAMGQEIEFQKESHKRLSHLQQLLRSFPPSRSV